MNRLHSLSSSPVRFLNDVKRYPESYWSHRGFVQALSLFHQAAKRVPAYKDFLHTHGINPDLIQTKGDFQKVPLIDKDNYIRKYPLESLCWDGSFSQPPWVISSTSGSTGEPTYFPRTTKQDKLYAALAEMYLRDNFSIHKRTTLYVNCFAMGVWIGGVFTHQAVKMVADRGEYSLSIISPGINKSEAIKAVQRLGDKFDQVIIAGYPPFVKDLIDDGIQEGLDWSQYNVGFIFSAESFSEAFRDYIFRKSGVKDIYRGSLNHYGTVDLGTMSHETPVSVLIRRLSLQHRPLFTRIFQHITKVPTFTQYIPEMFFFEDLEGSLVCTGDGGFPLIRYDLKDNGGVLSFSQIVDHCHASGVDIFHEMERVDISDTLWHLPFVYVYERRDLSTTLYGLNIYPETIRKALQHERFESFVTGKFTMLTKYNDSQDQYLEIHLELKQAQEYTDEHIRIITDHIVSTLKANNSEYHKLHTDLGERAVPVICMWPYEDLTYFRPGTKQKWVKK